MPAYLRRILASAWSATGPRIRALVAHPATHWAALSAGYAVVFTGYVGLLIALFTPELAVAVARVLLIVAVLAGIVVLAVHFGRLVNRRAPVAGAAQR